MLALVPVDQKTPNLATFADFWLLYPKRMDKRVAEKAWNKLSATDQLAALVGVAKWREVWLARGEMQYTPFPATFLNNARWEDDLPSEWVAKPNHASHVAFTAKPAVEVRGEIPAHVLDVIAKLRK